MTTWQQVTRVFQKNTNKLVKVIAGKDTIFATQEHPFYAFDEISNSNTTKGSWIPAGSLRKGLKVLLASGSLAAIDNALTFDTIAKVYNFEVRNTHTYYVSNGGLLVHNAYKPMKDIKSQFSTLLGADFDVNNYLNRLAKTKKLGTNLALDILARMSDFGDAQLLRKLMADIDDPIFKDHLKGKNGYHYASHIESWKKLAHMDDIIRKNPFWLDRIEQLNKKGFEINSIGKTVTISKGAKIEAIIDCNLRQTTIKFDRFGGDIICPFDRTVTVIGLFQESITSGDLGLWYFIEELKLSRSLDEITIPIEQSKVAGAIVNNNGALNILSIKNAAWSIAENKKWLNKAIERNDIIRIISDPRANRTLIRADGTPTVTALELDHLGVNPNSISSDGIIRR